jgi:hypothetical protein
LGGGDYAAGTFRAPTVDSALYDRIVFGYRDRSFARNRIAPRPRMPARIYSPAKTAMQSGKGKTGCWLLEFEPEKPKKIDPLMGYTTSGDMKSQIRLTFASAEEAVAYAERNEIPYRVEQPKEPKRRQISYAENFRYDRKTPWTH